MSERTDGDTGEGPDTIFTGGFLRGIPDLSCFDGQGLFGPPHAGSLPSPFDGANGGRLADRSGHPLPLVAIAELVTPSSGAISGRVEVAPAQVGGGIEGRVTGTAVTAIAARGAALRLLGLLAVEEQRSRSSGSGNNRRTESWVQVEGRIFSEQTFPDVALPATLAAGESFSVPFHIPAPRLGPPTAHGGSAVVAYAVDARWDLPMAADTHLAAPVAVAQHHDLLRAGVLDLGAGAFADTWDSDGATIAVEPHPPLAPGGDIEVFLRFPGAPAGRSVRLELVVEVDAPRSLAVPSVIVPIDPAALGGGVRVPIRLPYDLPPSLDVPDSKVRVRHVLRVVVDRPLRPDVTAMRRIAVG